MLFSQMRRDTFALWPIGTHPGRQTSRVLTFWSWLAGGRSFDLFFHQVYLGGNGAYSGRSEVIESIRDREAGTPAAKAFVGFACGERNCVLPRFHR